MQHEDTVCERRESPRVKVHVRVEERTENTVYFQRARDLSLGGIFLEGTLPHPPGTRVDLSLRFPGCDATLDVAGEVVERSPGDVGMAIRFSALSDATRAELERALA